MDGWMGDENQQERERERKMVAHTCSTVEIYRTRDRNICLCVLFMLNADAC